MTRGGLTLLETIASLLLLGMLAVASLGWVTTSQRSLAEISARTEWQRSAHATLCVLHDELLVGDEGLWSGTPVRLGPAINTQDQHGIERLEFRTRVPLRGPSDVVYRFDPESGQLSRLAEDAERVLLGEVNAFSVEVRRDDDGVPSAILVTLSRLGGATAERIVTLSGQEVAE